MRPYHDRHLRAEIPAAAGFGAALRAAREAAGLSQTQLADEAGFDHSFVARLEMGKREPSRDTILALAEVLESDAGDCDRLLAAAGYLPCDVASLLANEPAVGELYRILRDPRVPRPIRESLRMVLEMLARHWGTEVAS
jgi:transcriptional regulator with XRE-family HTH domain